MGPLIPVRRLYPTSVEIVLWIVMDFVNTKDLESNFYETF